MDDSLLVLWIVLLFPIAFGAIWSFAIFISSILGGWQKLAQLYRTDQPFEGEKFHYQSGQFGLNGYNGVLTVGVNRDGIYLVPMILFRMFHPPLLLPWKEVETEPTTFIFFSGYKVRFLKLNNRQVTLWGVALAGKLDHPYKK